MLFDYNRISYQQYLQSPHWKRTRKRALKAGRYKCANCGTSQTILETHHRSYQRMGHERLTDLIIYCGPCHTLEHSAKEIIHAL